MQATSGEISNLRKHQGNQHKQACMMMMMLILGAILQNESPVALIWGMSRHPASSSREAALALPMIAREIDS